MVRSTDITNNTNLYSTALLQGLQQDWDKTTGAYFEYSKSIVEGDSREVMAIKQSGHAFHHLSRDLGNLYDVLLQMEHTPPEKKVEDDLEFQRDMDEVRYNILPEMMASLLRISNAFGVDLGRGFADMVAMSLREVERAGGGGDSSSTG